MKKTRFDSPIDAEEWFYHSFASCSVQDMDKVWGDGNVVCIHPGANALVGRESVMHSWAKIFVAGEPPEINYEVVCATESGDLAVHVVEERLGQSGIQSGVKVMATNVYARSADGWHMVEHHGSQPMVRPQPQPVHSKRVLQ